MSKILKMTLMRYNKSKPDPEPETVNSDSVQDEVYVDPEEGVSKPTEEQT